MTRGRLVLVLVIAAVPTAFVATHFVCKSRDCDELTWLTREFKLTPAQVQQVAEIEKRYSSVCATHCDEIAQARAQITQLSREGRRSDPAYQAALQTWREKTSHCNESTRAHIEAVAAVMTPEQSTRYLALVTPLLEKQAHAGPQEP